jgi:hypothetical protein
LPSASVIRRYLEQFHNKEEENKRVAGTAFIPEKNELLEKLINLNDVLIDFAQTKTPSEIATLDQDATLVGTHKRTALYCYKNYKAYQPFNTYWHEQGLLLHSEFRDGNVPAGFEQLRLFQDGLNRLPDSVKKVFLRSDSAGYQQDLLEYCAKGKNSRFGIIEFAVAIRVTASFKESIIEATKWNTIYKKGPKDTKIKTNQEWAEINFVPTRAALSKKTPDYRYIAIREPFEEKASANKNATEEDLPFQTIVLDKQSYKLFGIVTNRTIDGHELVHWHRERCGESEHVHSTQKNGLAGGHLPSEKFGANAAWWQIMVLALNLIVLMNNLVLPEALKNKNIKALRFYVIGVSGKVIQHARKLYIRLSGDRETIDTLCYIAAKIAHLAHAPPAVVV